MAIFFRRLRGYTAAILFAAGLAFLVGGCAEEQVGSTDVSGEDAAERSNSGDGETSQNSGSNEIFTNENYGRLSSDPESYVGARVEIIGSLLSAPDFQDGQMAFQMFADPENMEWNTVVVSEGDVEPKAEDYVRVLGTVEGSFEGENAFGASILAPRIEASEVEIVSASEALDPARKTLQLSDTQEDQGFSITLNKLEFADNTTRVYVTAENGTEAPVSFYGFDSKIIQGTKQLDQEEPFEYNLAEPQSDLSPGVQTEGALVFGPVDPAQPFQIQFEWYSENFEITANPIVFEVDGNEVSSGQSASTEGTTTEGATTSEGDPTTYEAEAEAAATAYYQAAGLEDWAYTYDHLDSETQNLFTEEEWARKNQYYWDLNPTVYDILSVASVAGTELPTTEVAVRVTGQDGTSFVRTTYWVLEDEEWLHRFSQEEIDSFTPGVPF